MKKLVFAVLMCSLISGCGAGYVMTELQGTAKPEGGIAEVIPETKVYKADNAKVWKACLDVLDDQGFIFASDTASGRIKSDPKPLGDPGKMAITSASYYVIPIIKVDGSSVTYRARFNKESNLVQGGTNREYPEKENELRRDFFDALDNKLKI
jgi:hypothetical protein